MTFDDKALSLDWSNEKKVSNAGENKRHFQNGDVRKNDRYGKHSRNPLREREHRNYGSHRNYENGREDRYGFSDTSRSDSYFPARERGNGDRNRSFCSGNGHRAAYSGYGRRDEYGYGRDSGSHNTGSGQSGFRKYPDRNRRSDGEDFSRSSYRAGAQGRGRTSDRRREKPYGYDVFKPSRNRDDNPDFFWTEERSGIKRDK